jgi:hypothetical protein
MSEICRQGLRQVGDNGLNSAYNIFSSGKGHLQIQLRNSQHLTPPGLSA